MPSAPVLLAGDFAQALRRLLPRGRVWATDPESVQARLATGLGGVYARQTARANQLLVDAFPSGTVELLPEWEEALGLPDPCAGESPTVEQRRAHVVARLTNSGGQSAAYFIAYAAALGYTVSVENYAPFRAGRSRAGDAFADQDWSQTWAVEAPLETITWFRTGIGGAGEPLAAWGNTVLECELNAIKPAHAILQFHYT